MSAPTIDQRLSSYSIRVALAPGCPLERALRHAAFWESFPHCYTTRQYEAACALLTNINPDTADAVLALVDDEL